MTDGRPAPSSAAPTPDAELLDRFPFSTGDLAAKASISEHGVRAVVFHLGLQDDPKSFLLIRFGKGLRECYSHRALRLVRQAVKDGRVEEACTAYRARQ